MPIYYFKCTHCGKEIKKLLPVEAAENEYFCPDDGRPAQRSFKPPSSHVKEVIDNGLQMRRVEQFANSPELLQERADIAEKNKNKKDL